MMKIANRSDVKLLTDVLPSEVVEVVFSIASILDSEYGKNRDVEGANGGYIIIIEDECEVEKLSKIYIDMKTVIPEYVDLITVEDGENYTNSLILMNDDFGVSLIIPLSITPVNLLKDCLE